MQDLPRKGRPVITAALLFALSLAAAGVLAAQSGPYWPAPPPNAKVEYLSQFRSEKDFRHSGRSLWERVKRVLVGSHEEWTLRAPYALDVLRDKVYVTDTEARTVWVADFARETLTPFPRKPGKAGETLASPIGVAVESDGRVFVSDSAKNVVFVFSPQGKHLATLGNGRFGRPTGLAVDRTQQRLYVVDTVKCQVVVFGTDSLKELSQFGRRGSAPGEFNLPVHIAAHAGLLYVMDTMNFRVQVFDDGGQFLGQFGQMGDGPGDLPRSKGIGVDSEGHVYLSDALFDNVQVFDRAGKLMMSFGGLGEKKGQFWLPAGIAVDSRNRVYVADSANRRVQVFQYLGRGGE